jgi:lupus La protein
MSDAQPAAEAVSNPAESVVDKQVDAGMTAAKTEGVSAEAPKTETTDNQAGDKEAANGDSTDIKNEESPKRKDNYKRDNENGGRYKKDYHHKSDRNGRGRDSGRFNNKKRYVPCLFASHLLTDSGRSTEFDDLPESDDPVEIRNQV